MERAGEPRLQASVIWGTHTPLSTLATSPQTPDSLILGFARSVTNAGRAFSLALLDWPPCSGRLGSVIIRRTRKAGCLEWLLRRLAQQRSSFNFLVLVLGRVLTQLSGNPQKAQTTAGGRVAANQCWLVLAFSPAPIVRLTPVLAASHKPSKAGIRLFWALESQRKALGIFDWLCQQLPAGPLGAGRRTKSLSATVCPAPTLGQPKPASILVWPNSRPASWAGF